MAWVQGRTHVFRWSSSSREPNERVDGVLIRGILFVDVQQVLAIEGVVTTLASPCLVQKPCLVFIVVRSDSAAEDGKDIRARGGCCQHIPSLSTAFTTSVHQANAPGQHPTQQTQVYQDRRSCSPLQFLAHLHLIQALPFLLMHQRRRQRPSCRLCLCQGWVGPFVYSEKKSLVCSYTLKMFNLNHVRV